MNVLSLFDGMGCGQIALEKVGIKVDNYFASEIEPNAIKVVSNNYPNTIQLGDVTKWKEWHLPKIDLIIGGSPCQGFSRNGDGQNFNDPRSKLFFDFVDILNHYKPKYFLLENVEMKREWEDFITETLGVKPIKINSGLVSAQKRRRNYWTNIPGITQPKDKNINLLDIIADDVTEEDFKFNYNEIERVLTTKEKIYVRTGTKSEIHIGKNGDGIDMAIPTSITRRARIADGKTNTLDTGCKWAIFINGKIRWLTITELERLQTLPDGYTKGVPITKRKEMIGNGWNVDTIVHIFSFMEV